MCAVPDQAACRDKHSSGGPHAAQIPGLPPGAQVNQRTRCLHGGAELFQQPVRVVDEGFAVDAKTLPYFGLVEWNESPFVIPDRPFRTASLVFPELPSAYSFHRSVPGTARPRSRPILRESGILVPLQQIDLNCKRRVTCSANEFRHGGAFTAQAGCIQPPHQCLQGSGPIVGGGRLLKTPEQKRFGCTAPPGLPDLYLERAET